MATGEGELEELGRAVGAELAERDVVEAEVLGARQHVGVGLDPGDELAQDDAEAEHVAPLVVPLAAQALRRHPVRAAHRRQAVAIPRNNADEAQSLSRASTANSVLPRLNGANTEQTVTTRGTGAASNGLLRTKERHEPRIGDLGGETEIADDGRQIARRIVALNQNVLRKNCKDR